MNNILNDANELRLKKIEFLQKGFHLLEVRKKRRNYRKMYYEKVLQYNGVLRKLHPTTFKGWFLNPNLIPKEDLENTLLILEENLVVTLYQQAADAKELYKKEINKLKVDYQNLITPIEKLLEENPWKQ